MGVVYGAAGLWQWKVRADEPGWQAWCSQKMSWKDALELEGSAYVGMAPEAGLAMQAVEENLTGLITGLPLDLYELFPTPYYTYTARVHSNSWGATAGGAYTGNSESVDEFVWDHPDMTILFSAGNAGIDADGDGQVDRYSLAAPGTAKNAITIGASENDRLEGGYNPGGDCSTWGSCWASRQKIVE